MVNFNHLNYYYYFLYLQRYCSNLYPNVAESQRICNWCLSQKDDAKEKSQNSSNSSSSFKNDAVSQDDTGDQDAKRAVKSNNPRATNQQAAMIKRQPEGAGPGRPCRLILRRHGSATMRLAGPIKKQRSIEALALPSPPPPPPRKRIVTAGAKEAERLRRTRSEDIVKVGITKQVFRNRVRRYKLLDEVSS